MNDIRQIMRANAAMADVLVKASDLCEVAGTSWSSDGTLRIRNPEELRLRFHALECSLGLASAALHEYRIPAPPAETKPKPKTRKMWTVVRVDGTLEDPMRLYEDRWAAEHNRSLCTYQERYVCVPVRVPIPDVRG